MHDLSARTEVEENAQQDPQESWLRTGKMHSPCLRQSNEAGLVVD